MDHTYNGKAPVFCTSLGHNNQTVDDPRYLTLVTRGLLWQPSIWAKTESDGGVWAGK